MHSRAIRFFGDIVPIERINAPYEKPKSAVDEGLLEVLWDALNGRGKRAARKVKRCKVSDEYYLHPEDAYAVDWNAEIEKALEEANNDGI